MPTIQTGLVQRPEQIEPQIVLSNFELELSFPTTELKDCYFHFSQALMRKFQTYGLHVVYREHEDDNRFLYEELL